MIGLVEDGDLIEIDIPARSISLVVDDADARRAPRGHAARRREGVEARQKRSRKVTMALKAYAALTTSAARGAVRVVPE